MVIKGKVISVNVKDWESEYGIMIGIDKIYLVVCDLIRLVISVVRF